MNLKASIELFRGLIFGPFASLSKLKGCVPAVLELANIIGKREADTLLFVIVTFEEVKLEVAVVARVVFVAVPNKDPVNPSVAITDPVILKSAPAFDPVIAREPVITASPTNGKDEPPPPEALMVTDPVPIAGDIVMLGPAII